MLWLGKLHPLTVEGMIIIFGVLSTFTKQPNKVNEGDDSQAGVLAWTNLALRLRL